MSRNPLDYQLNSSLNKSNSSFITDPILFTAVLAILTFGLVCLYSASGQDISMVTKQGIYISLGIILMLIISSIKERYYRPFLINLFWIGLLLLIWVLFFPAQGYNTDRWIDLGPFGFQPSELVRLTLPLAVAYHLTRKDRQPDFLDWLVVLFFIALSSFLVFKQPDLGTSIIVFISGFLPVFLSGFPLSIIFAGFISLIALSPLIWMSLSEYMKGRIFTFIDPNADPLGAGWNIAQSKTAIGSGGIFGKGYLNGTQSQLDFLPESHSDFIFSVIAEEFGLVGISFLFFLYGIILYRIFVISFNANTQFSRVCSASLGFIFLIYLVINVCMVSGIFPVVGVPLPLISQGGTSIIVHLMAFGFVLSLKRVETW